MVPDLLIAAGRYSADHGLAAKGLALTDSAIIVAANLENAPFGVSTQCWWQMFQPRFATKLAQRTAHNTSYAKCGPSIGKTTIVNAHASKAKPRTHKATLVVLLAPSFLLACSIQYTKPIDAAPFFQAASDYPYYLNFTIAPTTQVTARLPVTTPGKYQLAFGANREFTDRFAALVLVFLNGEGHKEIPYRRVPMNGRIFLVLDFSVKRGDAYRDMYVDCHIAIANPNNELMSPEDAAQLRQSVLEFGFRKVADEPLTLTVPENPGRTSHNNR